MNRIFRLACLAGLAATWSGAVAQPHHARGLAQVGSASDSYNVNNNFAPQQAEATVAGAGSARASGSMAFGFNTVTAQLSNSGPVSWLHAQAQNRWADRITINAAGLAGTEGSMFAKVRFRGTSSFDFSGAYATHHLARVSGYWNGFVLASFDGGNGWFETGVSGSWSQNPNNRSELIYQGPNFTDFTMEVSVPFTFGEEFHLAGYLETGIVAENPALLAGSVTAMVDFSPGAQWQGITGIYDMNFTQVSNATVSSASGTNYMQPVPEPATITASLLGLAALIRRRRRS